MENQKMNRKVSSFVLKALIPAIFLGFGSAVQAKQPKVSILHCGVDEGTEVMTYKEISVSISSKGHAKHGELESVETEELDPVTGEPIFVDYVRMGDDCLLEDASGVLGLQSCGEVVEVGDECGMLQPMETAGDTPSLQI
jgi:hypothetical protein